jgi:hypothetical protein
VQVEDRHEHREQERAAVGQHVAGFGQQGNRIGERAAERLDDSEGQHDAQGQQQPVLARAATVIMAVRAVRIVISAMRVCVSHWRSRCGSPGVNRGSAVRILNPILAKNRLDSPQAATLK